MTPLFLIIVTAATLFSLTALLMLAPWSLPTGRVGLHRGTSEAPRSRSVGRRRIGAAAHVGALAAMALAVAAAKFL